MSETKATIGDVYRCAKCGGTNVEFEESNWYDPHTGENIGDGMRLDGEFCNDCQEDHGINAEYGVELPPELAERIAAHEREERIRAAAHDLLAALRPLANVDQHGRCLSCGCRYLPDYYCGCEPMAPVENGFRMAALAAIAKAEGRS